MRKILRKNYKLYYFVAYIYDKLMAFYYRYISNPEKIIRRRYKRRLGRVPNLKNPETFNDKVQWLKLNWYDPFAVKCADKYKVRKVIKEKIGIEYLNKIIAVYDRVEQINLEKLPKSFVLKGTHGSGYNIVCRDKSTMNWDLEFHKMRRWLRNKYYLKNGEWVYKGIRPKIICEEFLVDANQKHGLTDYKFYCFQGEPEYCQVIKNRDLNPTIDFYDMNWNHMEFTGLQDLPRSPEPDIKPEKFQEMYEIAQVLSKRFPFVRVDLYYVENKIYFGELTFFPRSGFGTFTPVKWNKKMGDLLKLPTSSQ